MKMQKLKMIIDVLLTIALLLLMPYGMVGEAAHEWIGAAMFVLFVIHHILNWKWTKHIGKGKYGAFRIVQTGLVFFILLSILGSMVSGIAISRHVFAFIRIRGISAPARTVHMICAYWGFVLMSLHLGLHWRVILGAAGKMLPKPETDRQKNTRTWTARLLGAAIAVYGLYAFIKRDLLSYMLMRVHFVFFDYSEPVLLFILDYTAAMGMFIFLGHYLGKGIQKIGRK